jgi:CheY-like chemotaxis protein
MNPLVLVVDDSVEFLDVARRLLEAARPGTSVHTVQTGAAALAFLVGEASNGTCTRPRFVVLDFRLPDMNAPELLARLRAEPALATLPVLVLSQAGWPEDARAALAAGASAFVVKPSRAGALRRVLDDFWSRHAD